MTKDLRRRCGGSVKASLVLFAAKSFISHRWPALFTGMNDDDLLPPDEESGAMWGACECRGPLCQHLA